LIFPISRHYFQEQKAHAEEFDELSWRWAGACEARLRREGREAQQRGRIQGVLFGLKALTRRKIAVNFKTGGRETVPPVTGTVSAIPAPQSAV
jgi:hypothetical protein